MYTYDYDGTLIGFSYDPDINTSNNEEDYFYLRNLQGDITHILNASGISVVHYVYDAYGNITKTEITSGYGYIANINSYTYRGYRYDSEINMYYLNSRYYNPELGRYINSDGLFGEQGNIISTNMYAYCSSNPINKSDESGFFWNIIAGASIGFLVGFSINIVMQAVNGQDISITSALVSGVSGALSGAIASTGVGVGLSVLGNGLIGGTENIATSLLNNQDINLLSLGVSVGIGMLSGALSGKGFYADDAYNSAMKQTTKAFAKAEVGAFKTIGGCKSSLTQATNRLFREFSRNITSTLGRQTASEVVGEIGGIIKDWFIN